MKTIVRISYIFVAFICHNVQVSCTITESPTHFLEPGDVVQNPLPGLRIFCHNAKSKYLVNIWKTLIMNLRTTVETYELYDGKTPSEVKEKHEDNQKSWRLNFFGTKKNKQFKINPFEDVCIGVYTQMQNQYQYEMSMTQLQIDTWKVMTMGIGILIFWYAKQLSQNSLFYYLCGVTLGVTTSVIIVIYFVAKLFPKGKFMYLTVITGYTMSFYLAQLLWDNAQLIAMQYKEWVIWYVLISSAFSFAICYRFGPVTNSRTRNIIQWFLQALGLCLIYQSSYFVEASTSVCILVILAYNFPIVLLNRGRRYWTKMFPARQKLLTDDQYREEGIKETKKALEGLKEYCSSPECKPWKTVLRLKDPIRYLKANEYDLRFAKFMEGDSHLSDYEAEEHDLEITRIIESEFTDDEIDDY